MEKNKTLSKLTKTAIAAGVLASAVAPYAVEASTIANTGAAVTTALNALDPTKSSYVTDVEAVVAVYDGLGVIEKPKVTTANVTKLNNHRSAAAVVKKINTIPDVEDIQGINVETTLKEYKDTITAIKSDYTKLSMTARTFVKNYTTVTSKEVAVNNQLSYLTNKTYLSRWETAAGALSGKTVDLQEITVDTYEVATKYTDDELTAITTARTEYNKLTTALRNLVKTTDLTKLQNQEAQAKLQNALLTQVNASKVSAFAGLVTALDPTKDTYVTDVGNVNTAYNALDGNTKASLTSTTKTSLANHTTAVEVVNKINTTTTVAAIEAADQAALTTIKEKLAGIRTEYATLSMTARSYIKNLATLTTLEAAVTTRQNVINASADLDAWTTAITALKAMPVKDFSAAEEDIAAFANISKYETGESGDTKKIDAARTEYDALSGTLKRLVSPTDLAVLTNHEAAYVKQEQLQTLFATYEKEVADAQEQQKKYQDDYDAFKTQLAKFEDKLATYTALADAEAFKVATGLYSPTDLENIASARSLYDSFTAGALKIFEESPTAGTDYTKMINSGQAAAKHKAFQATLDQAAQNALQQSATAFEGKVTALTTETDVTKYIADAKALDITALDNGVKALVKPEVETVYNNHKAAVVVIEEISKLASVENIEAVTALDALTPIKSAVNTAETNYLNDLTWAQKQLVKNYSDLTSRKSAVVIKEASLTKETALKPFKDAMVALSTATNFASISEADVKTFTDVNFSSSEVAIKKYDGAAETAITTARNTYKGLVADYQTEVASAEAILIKHEAALEKQKELLIEAGKYGALATQLGQFKTEVGKITATVKSFENGLTKDPGTSKYNNIYTDAEILTIEAAATAYKTLTEATGYDAKFLGETVPENKAAYDKYASHITALGAQKQLIATAESDELTALKLKIEGFKVADANGDATKLEELVKAVTEAKEKVESYKENNALPEAVTTAIGSTNLTKLDNYVTAMGIVDKILKLDPTYNTAVLTNPAEGQKAIGAYITPANEVKGEYDVLVGTTKTLVYAANFTALKNYITAVEAKKKALEIAAAIADWTTAYDAMTDGGVDVLTIDEDNFDYKTFTYYTDPQLGLITDANNANTTLTSLGTEYVAALDTTKAAKLKAINDTVTLYNKLKDAQVSEEQRIATALTAFNAAWDVVKDVAAIDYSLKTIADMPFTGDLAYADGVPDNIQKAINEYDKLDDEFVATLEEAVRAKVLAFRTSLKDLKDRNDEFAKKAEIDAALTDWKAAIGALAEDKVALKNYALTISKDNVDTSTFVAYAENVAGLVDTADKAYTALKTHELGDLQKYVIEADLDRLGAFKEDLKAYDKALLDKQTAEKEAKMKELETAIKGLVLTSETYVADVDAAQAKKLALASAIRAEFDKDYPVESATLVNHVAISKVVIKVQALPKEAEINATTTLGALTTYETALTGARAAYDALTGNQKALYADSIKALEDIAKAQRTKLENAEKISAWTLGSSKLPAQVLLENVTSTTYTTTELQAVESLRGIYTGYDQIQKGLVDNLNNGADLAKLVALEAIVEKQKGLQLQDTHKTALAGWTAAYEPVAFEAYDFTNVTAVNFGDESVNKYTEAQEIAVSNAESIYNALLEDAKKLVNADHYKNLLAHKTAISKQAGIKAAYDQALVEKGKADKVTGFVTALTNLAPETADYVEAFKAVQTLYEGLVAETLDTKLISVQKNSYNNHKAAVAVVEGISLASAEARLTGATTLESLTTIEQELNDAKNDYAKLSMTARTYVKNYTSIATTLTVVENKKKALENASAISAWTAAYPNLPELLNFDNETFETIVDAPQYSTTDIQKVEALRGIYDNYTATVKGYVDSEQYNRLVAFEKSIDRQVLLLDQAENADTISGALSDWTTAIAKIPTAIDVSNLSVDNFKNHEKYGEGIEADVKAARDAYTALDVATKVYVVPADLQRLEAVEKSLVKFKEIQSAVNAGAAVTEAESVTTDLTGISLTSENFIEDAINLKAAYDALSAEAKAKITTTQKNNIINYGTAAAVIKSINELVSVETIQSITKATELDTHKQSITDIRTAYTALSMTARTYVKNYATVTTVEAAVNAQVKVIANKDALVVSWNPAVAALPTVVAVENVTVATYDEGAELKITTARQVYNGLSSTVKSVVEGKDLQLLLDLEASLKAQKDLIANQATTDAADLMKKVTALNPSAEETYVADVGKVSTQFKGLSVSALAKLTTANKTLIGNHEKAAAVVDAINKIALANEDEASIKAYKEAVATARAEYTALTTLARTFVKNLSTLTAHEADIKLLP